MKLLAKRIIKNRTIQTDAILFSIITIIDSIASVLCSIPWKTAFLIIIISFVATDVCILLMNDFRRDSDM